MNRIRILFTAALAFGVALVAFGALTGSDGAEPLPAARAAAAGQARSTDGQIAALQRALRASPRPDGYAALAGALMQKVRETGDVTLYEAADQAVQRALALEPRNASALTQAAALALARHDFRGALRLARRARAAAPDVVRSYAVLVDALVELGRQDAAEAALQEMIDAKPTLSAYARASYVRELRGDLAGAAQAMELAVAAGGDTPENGAAAQALLGDLELARGDAAAAEHAYRGALARFGSHAPSQAGLARVAGARGDLRTAIRGYEAVVDRLPLPEYAVALGEAQLAAGDRAGARASFDLVGAQVTLLGAAGVDADTALAVFEADHGDADRAVRLARRARHAAPSVRTADALGWALTRAGRPREGLAWARRALALGSADARLRYHAGIAARDAGKPALARHHLRIALRAPAILGPYHAARAREALR